MAQLATIIILLICAPLMESVIPASPAFVFAAWLAWTLHSLTCPKEEMHD